MKKFISVVVGIGILTGIGSAFTSAFSFGSCFMVLSDGRCEDTVIPIFLFPYKLDEKYTKN